MSYFSQLGLSSSGTGYAGGWRKGDVAEDLPPLPAPDGELERIIEEGELTADYEDYLADVEWLRTGC
jgi:hypothetical protein